MSATVLQRDTAIMPVRGRAIGAKQLAAFALLAALAGGGAWYGHDWWTNGRFLQSTDDAYVGGNVTTIAPHVSGFVTGILVADNQHVTAGQLLVQLDRRDYQTANDRAQAVLAAKTAALSNLRARQVLQQSAIRQSAADQNAKIANAAYTRIDSDRYARLALTYDGSRQNAQKTDAARQVAEADVLAADAALEAAHQQMKVLDTQIAEAQAEIGQAESDLRMATLNLGYTEIRSPIDGYIGNRAAQTGAYVTQGNYLLSVIPAQGLWIDANFKEDQLAHMAQGQPVLVSADVAPGHPLHGHVESMAPGTGAVFSVIPPENATGNFTKIVQRVPVRIALDPTESGLGRLRPGLSTYVTVDTKSAP
jgi:membrane fusion protein (multidrug efflux system)